MRCNTHSSNLFSRLHLPSVVVLANCELRAVASSIRAVENDVLSRDRLFNNEDKISGYFELGVVTNAVLGVQNPSRTYGSFMWRPKRQRYQRSHVSMLRKNRSGSGRGQVAGTRESGNERLGSVTCGEFLDYLRTS